MKLILAQGKGFASWLVRVVTKSPYTHAAIVYDDNVTVLHSSLDGVELTTMDYINSHYTQVCAYQCVFAEAKEAAIATQSTYVGFKYDRMSFVGLGIALLLGLKKNPLGRKNELMCSEVPAYWLNFAHTLNPNLRIPKLDPEMQTPASLKHLCDNRTDLFLPIA
jgi:hypothetical protein